MKVFTLAIATALLAAGAAQATVIPKLTGPVNDYAGVLNHDQAESLSSKLLAAETKTTNQVVVLTVKSLDGQDIESYAHDVFHAWGLGVKKEVNKPGDNGVLFVVAVADHKMRIEVGYGLEGSLTDAEASRIINDDVKPKFRAGDFPGGIRAAVDDIEKAASTFPATQPADAEGTSFAWFTLIFTFVFGAIAIIWVVVARLFRQKTPAVTPSSSRPYIPPATSFGTGFIAGAASSTRKPSAYRKPSSSSSYGSSSSSSSNSSSYDSGSSSFGSSDYSGGGGDSGGGGASGSW